MEIKTLSDEELANLSKEVLAEVAERKLSATKTSVTFYEQERNAKIEKIKETVSRETILKARERCEEFQALDDETYEIELLVPVRVYYWLLGEENTIDIDDWELVDDIDNYGPFIKNEDVIGNIKKKDAARYEMNEIFLRVAGLSGVEVGDIKELIWYVEYE